MSGQNGWANEASSFTFISGQNDLKCEESHGWQLGIALMLYCKVNMCTLMKKAEKVPAEQFSWKQWNFWGKHLLSQENEERKTCKLEPVVPKPSCNAAEQW